MHVQEDLQVHYLCDEALMVILDQEAQMNALPVGSLILRATSMTAPNAPIVKMENGAWNTTTGLPGKKGRHYAFYLLEAIARTRGDLNNLLRGAIVRDGIDGNIWLKGMNGEWWIEGSVVDEFCLPLPIEIFHPGDDT